MTVSGSFSARACATGCKARDWFRATLSRAGSTSADVVKFTTSFTLGNIAELKLEVIIDVLYWTGFGDGTSEERKGDSSHDSILRKP